MRYLIRVASLSVVCLLLLNAGVVSAEPIRLACVGDSITAGAGTTNREAQSYPAQLGRMLGGEWQVYNFGVGGATLLKHGNKPYWNLATYTNALACAPQVVVIMLGTNDTKPQNWKFHDEFVADYNNLIAQFAKLASKPRILICRPPFVSGTNAYAIVETGIRAEIPMIDTVARENGVRVIDNHAAFEKNPALLPDHVHPNEEGYAVLARTVYEAVLEVK